MQDISDEKLALMFVKAMPVKQMAEELDTSVKYLCQVKYGFVRPAVKDIMIEMSEQVKALAIKSLHANTEFLIQKHIEAAENIDETGRKCREYLLNHILGDPSKTNIELTNNNVGEVFGDSNKEETDRVCAAITGFRLDERFKGPGASDGA